MPCLRAFPCHAVSLSVYIVSLPFDLHSAAVFDSHIPCHARAALLPCPEHAVLKATSQGHGTARRVWINTARHDRGTAWTRHAVCELTRHGMTGERHEHGMLCVNYPLVGRSVQTYVEASWNVMGHAQKPDFVFRRNGRVHLNRRGRQFSRLLAASAHQR